MLFNFLTAWHSNFEDPKLFKQVISSGQCQCTAVYKLVISCYLFSCFFLLCITFCWHVTLLCLVIYLQNTQLFVKFIIALWTILFVD